MRPRPITRLLLASAAMTAAALLTGCGTDSPGDSVPLPNPNAGFDYQLGGAYPPPDGVTIVERDRTAQPAGLGYDICYVNGFQTQPEESDAFAAEHPELLVQRGGEPLRDAGWPDEFVFDTSTAQKRQAIAEIVGQWIASCETSGFDAVEIDNLDSYTRSEGMLGERDNIELAIEYARIAHEAGLAIAQKNAPELAPELKEAGYDFAVAESCYRFSECESYTSAYPVVLDIEYDDELEATRFVEACRDPGRPSTMILRDHDLVPSTHAAYRYRSCEH